MRRKQGKSRSSDGHQRGFSLISILAALVIGGLVYAAFFHLQSGGTSQDLATATRGAGQTVACQMNRQALERTITTWSISHPGAEPTLAALKESGTPVLPCPEGGEFMIRDRQVQCSTHP